MTIKRLVEIITGLTKASAELSDPSGATVQMRDGTAVVLASPDALRQLSKTLLEYADELASLLPQDAALLAALLATLTADTGATTPAP